MRASTILLPLAVVVAGAVALAVWLSRPPARSETLRLPSVDVPMVTTSGPAAGNSLVGRLTPGPGKPADSSGSWPCFRGPQLDGVSRDPVPLARQWSAQGPRKMWQVDLGEGYAGAAIHKGRVYVLDYIPPRDENSNKESPGTAVPGSAAPEFGDALRCLSLDDGREIWRYVYPVVVQTNHGISRTIPAVNDHYVVSLGPKCHVTCLDAMTGQLAWAIDLHKQFGSTVPQWYAGQCPIIDGDRVILAPAGSDVLMMAVDLVTGRVLWRTPNPMKWKMTHVSVVPMEVGGQRMFVYCGSGGMAGVATDDGRILWQTTEWKIAVATVPTPVILPDGRLLVTGDYNAGSMMFQVTKSGDKFAVRRLWKLPPQQFASRQQTPIFHEGYLYAIRPDGLLACLHPDGRVVWTSGTDTFGLGPVLIAQGLIFALNDDGTMVLAEASPAGYRPLARAKVLPGGECWGPLSLADGRLIARDIRRMVCLDMRNP